jgi:putative ABC transport system permease protein
MILFMATFTALTGYGLGIGLVTLMISSPDPGCPTTRP